MPNSSFFTGIGSLIDAYQQSAGGGANKQLLVAFPAQVIDICLDDKSPLYKDPTDIGKIRFRNLITNKNSDENSVSHQASMLDRSVARYPLPGEEVVVYNLPGQVDVFFYQSVVAINRNITSNIEPALAGNFKAANKQDNSIAETRARFDKKLKDVNLVKDINNNYKVYKELKPREGDFILQGRFGTSIRFGSTAANQDPKVTSWSDNESGVSGDGIVTIRADRDYTTVSDDMLTYEDVNRDDASIYLCTSQNIKIELACSSNLKSWAARFNLLENK